MLIDTTGGDKAGDQNQQSGEHLALKEAMRKQVEQYMAASQTKKTIRGLLQKENQRLGVNMDELRRHSPELAKYVQRNPIDAVHLFETSLDRIIKEMNDDSSKTGHPDKQAAGQNDKAFPTKTKRYYVNFEGNFGRNLVTPRGLKSTLINNLVSVRGIVTRIGLVKPMIQTSVHYCETTKRGHVKHYDDVTNIAEMGDDTKTMNGGSENFMTKDPQGNPLTPEYGYCLYKDSQMVTIQEMPENAPPGQLPRSVQVILQNDLVDKIKPGDRVQVTGVYRAAPNVTLGVTRGTFRTHIIATGVQSLLLEKEKPSLSEKDISNFRKLSRQEDLFDVLGGSIAPSIEGNLQVKKSILLQLLGGAEKIIENGTHLRGDINIMMVGDPSTAKSQLLRHIMDIAPLAINTTGKGSSGVGLTAAVTMDKDTGDRHLEAGAMVLADRGIVCIDEFDKMNDNDRVAIHEVMEQQTVTIAKAGIHCSLNARCSVIAAANPIYSEYARDLSVAKNIGLPDSLLSRFDLLFVMLDEKEPEFDRKIAQRVITNHRALNQDGYKLNYFNDDTVIEPEMANENNQDGVGTTMFEKEAGSGVNSKLVTREFLKKYISFVKSQKPPELGNDACQVATAVYTALRQKATVTDQNKQAVPITVRTLETIIRLATAHAKLRLSKHVENQDVEVAFGLLRQTIFQEEEPQHYKADEEMVTDKETDNDTIIPLSKRAAATRRGRPLNDDDAENQPPNSKRMKKDEDEEVQQLLQASIVQKSAETTQSIYDSFQKKLVFKMISAIKDGQNKCGIDALWKRYLSLSDRESMRKGTDKPLIDTKDELLGIIEALESDNLVMMAAEDNQVILI